MKINKFLLSKHKNCVNINNNGYDNNNKEEKEKTIILNSNSNNNGFLFLFESIILTWKHFLSLFCCCCCSAYSMWIFSHLTIISSLIIISLSILILWSSFIRAYCKRYRAWRRVLINVKSKWSQKWRKRRREKLTRERIIQVYEER